MKTILETNITTHLTLIFIHRNLQFTTKKYVICSRFIKNVVKFCVTNSLNIEILIKTKKLHIYKCVDLISKVHAFKCVIFIVKKVYTLKRGLFVT